MLCVPVVPRLLLAGRSQPTLVLTLVLSQAAEAEASTSREYKPRFARLSLTCFWRLANDRRRRLVSSCNQRWTSRVIRD